MKKTVIAIALALVSFTLSAKTLVTSPSGMELIETAGIYSLKTNTGVIPMGDLRESLKTLLVMEKRFAGEVVSDVLDLDGSKYNVLEDKQGKYIIKAGLGVVKVRRIDTKEFIGVLSLSGGFKMLKELYAEIKEEFNTGK